jgi:hypothetical protein
MTLDEAREHIGHGVLYQPSGGFAAEQGVITSVNNRWVFVRYGIDGSRATDPALLSLLAVPSPPRAPAVVTPAGPAASTVSPRGAAATPGAPSSPRDGVPGTSPPLPGLAQGGGEAQASGRQAWKAAIAAHSRAQRTGRATRAAAPIVGVRAAQRPRGEQR